VRSHRHPLTYRKQGVTDSGATSWTAAGTVWRKEPGVGHHGKHSGEWDFLRERGLIRRATAAARGAYLAVRARTPSISLA
jgi:hypothetical protein